MVGLTGNLAYSVMNPLSAAYSPTSIALGIIVGVFKGNYTGTNPEDPSDTIDLRTAYIENENTSYPLFHYVLDDVITIEK